MWAILAWLSVLAHHNSRADQPLVSVEDIVVAHWRTFGRNYYSRYDYENVASDAAAAVMAHLTTLVAAPPTALFAAAGFTLHVADSFSYTDPVDASVSSNQGLRFVFTDGSRIIFRLSGTGSVGATIRVYIEKYESAADKLSLTTAVALEALSGIALQLARMQELTGRDAPTVIT